MSHCVHSAFTRSLVQALSRLKVPSSLCTLLICIIYCLYMYPSIVNYTIFFHRSPDSSRHFSQPCLTGPRYCIFFFSKYCAVCELLCNLLLFHLCLCTLRCTCIIPMCQVFFSCNILEKKLSTDRVRYFSCFLLIHVFGEI